MQSQLGGTQQIQNYEISPYVSSRNQMKQQSISPEISPEILSTSPTSAHYIRIETISYYLYCDDQHPINPLYTALNRSYTHLLAVNESIQSLIHQSDHHQFDQLYSTYNSTVHGMSALGKRLDCGLLHDEKSAVVDSVCIDGVSQWFRLYILQLGMVLVLLVRNCCLCCGLQYKYQRKRVMKQLYGSISSEPSVARYPSWDPYCKDDDPRFEDEDIGDVSSFSVEFESRSIEKERIDTDSIRSGKSGRTMRTVRSTPSGPFVKYSINTPPYYVQNIVSPPTRSTAGGDRMEDDGMTIYKFHPKRGRNSRKIKVYVRRENGETEYVRINRSANQTIHNLKEEIVESLSKR